MVAGLVEEYMIGNQSLVDNCVVTKAATLSYKTHPQLLMELRDLVYLVSVSTTITEA